MIHEVSADYIYNLTQPVFIFLFISYPQDCDFLFSIFCKGTVDNKTDPHTLNMTGSIIKLMLRILSLCLRLFS